MDKYQTEKLKQYLVGLGVSYNDVDAIINDYTKSVSMRSYKKGWSRCKRVNQACRIFNRNLAIQDFEEFNDRWAGQLPVDTMDEFQNIFYAQLPYIS